MNSFHLNKSQSYIHFNLEPEITEVIVYNILGEIENILKVSTNAEKKMPIKHLSAGQYLIKLMKHQKVAEGYKIVLKK
jgi:hypothetical protein